MTSGPSSLDHATLQQAADWFARLQEHPDDSQLRAQWQSWLDRDTSCRLAWSYIERVSQRFGGLQEQGATAHRTLTSLRRGKHTRRQVLGVFAGGLLSAYLAWRLPWRDKVESLLAEQRTRVGEIRHLVLADGTRIWLNSDTALDIRLSAAERRLDLHDGEVLIETAHDPRPFSVQTSAGTLTPLGTRFSVRKEGQMTRVTVFQGAVKAICRTTQRSAVISAGQGLAFDKDSPGHLETAQLQRQSWAQGLLLADDMRLGDFIDELARYRPGHLGLDEGLRDLRVTGSFSLHDTDQALTQLEEILPVRVSRRFSWWTSLDPI